LDAARGRLSDADGDGMSDWAEFIAGTNPTNTASRLTLQVELLPGTGSLRLACAATPGRAYRFWGRTENSPWVPLSDWIRATGYVVRFTLPEPRTGGTWFYRVEVQP